MNKQTIIKRNWTKPAVKVLNIKKDTFSGSVSGTEGAGKVGPPRPAPYQPVKG